MAKAKQEFTQVIKDETELEATLKKLSQERGGAWVFSIKPFSHEVHFAQYQSPSKVPDHYLQLTDDMIAYKGRLQRFTEAAKIREQNRALGRR